MEKSKIMTWLHSQLRPVFPREHMKLIKYNNGKQGRERVIK